MEIIQKQTGNSSMKQINSNGPGFGAYIIASIYVFGNWAYRQFLTDGQGNLSFGAIFLSVTGITLMILSPDLIIPSILLASLTFLVQRLLVRIPSGLSWNFGSSCGPSTPRGNVYEHQ